MSARLLFDDTISCRLPENFVDISSFRQVPDHQQVFAASDGSDCTWILEIVEMDVGGGDLPAEHHFHLLAMDNEASTDELRIVDRHRFTPKELPLLSPEFQVSFVEGVQCIAKFNNQHVKDIVFIALATIRLPSVGADILISLNWPLQTSVAEGSVPQELEKAQESFAANQIACKASSIFLESIKSFEIKSMGLFGTE